MKGEQKADEVDPQVQLRLGEGLRGGVDPQQHLPGQRRPQGEHRQGEEQAENQGGGKFPPHLIILSGALEFGDHHGSAQTDTGGAQNQNGDDGIGGADGGQGVLPQKFADDDGVHRVISQLENVPQNHGDGVLNEMAGDAALCHVLHGILPRCFICFFEKRQCVGESGD